jgi:MFS family permease
MFSPGIQQIADDLNTTKDYVIGCTTGFVIMLGIGPLFLAPLSETFGRRKIYIYCYTAFSILQIPSALAPNIGTLLAVRTISGFFGAVAIANGLSSLILSYQNDHANISQAVEPLVVGQIVLFVETFMLKFLPDMFVPEERAGVFGWYLLGPLLGPTLGPLFGGIIVQRAGWRWIFWTTTIICFLNTIVGYFFLHESYAPVLLSRRKANLESEEGAVGKYRFEGEDDRPLSKKLAHSLARPFKIILQPIVLIMSAYQALIFGTTYSLYTNMQAIFQGDYGFTTEQVGLLYLGPGLGFLTSVWFLVPQIDRVYKALGKRNNCDPVPEYRLPLANIGAVLIPVSLFCFFWAVEKHAHWALAITATYFYGAGQVMILNCTQNYYIDSFEKYAASAIAAGAVFRSLFGGIVPLLAPSLFKALGYGWGGSVFGFLALAIAPAPLLFYRYGGAIREKFKIEL